MPNHIFNLALSYFLCEYSPKSKPRKTADLVRELGLRHFSSGRVDEFIDENLLKLQSALVDEFNDRYEKNSPLRFEIADKFGEGSIIKGSWQKPSRALIKFQDVLHAISHNDFEKLSAVLLKKIGCQSAFFTPESHDQGIDAFGYQSIIEPIPHGVVHNLVWIAQAKHYNSTQVSTSDIREMVGSKELLVSRIFSTVDERYKELSLRPYAPTALVLVTSEEIPSTVRRLAERGGLFVFAASDIYAIFKPLLLSCTQACLLKLIQKEGQSITTLP